MLRRKLLKKLRSQLNRDLVRDLDLDLGIECALIARKSAFDLQHEESLGQGPEKEETTAGMTAETVGETQGSDPQADPDPDPDPDPGQSRVDARRLEGPDRGQGDVTETNAERDRNPDRGRSAAAKSRRSPRSQRRKRRPDRALRNLLAPNQGSCPRRKVIKMNQRKKNSN